MCPKCILNSININKLITILLCGFNGLKKYYWNKLCVVLRRIEHYWSEILLCFSRKEFLKYPTIRDVIWSYVWDCILLLSRITCFVSFVQYKRDMYIIFILIVKYDILVSKFTYDAITLIHFLESFASFFFYSWTVDFIHQSWSIFIRTAFISSNFWCLVFLWNTMSFYYW